jgi:hypothetical protein
MQVMSGSTAFSWRYYRIIWNLALSHTGVFSLIEILGQDWGSKVSVICLIFIISVFNLILQFVRHL